MEKCTVCKDEKVVVAADSSVATWKPCPMCNAPRSTPRSKSRSNV
jgi:hypothetical protein